MTLNATKMTRLQWAAGQDLIQAGVRLERLRLLSELGGFDSWPEAEQQRAERVLYAYADTMEWINCEVQTADEAAMMRAQLDRNLEVINAFLTSAPTYLREPEFSALLRQTVLASAEKGEPVEQHREIGS